MKSSVSGQLDFIHRAMHVVTGLSAVPGWNSRAFRNLFWIHHLHRCTVTFVVSRMEASMIDCLVLVQTEVGQDSMWLFTVESDVPTVKSVMLDGFSFSFSATGTSK